MGTRWPLLWHPAEPPQNQEVLPLIALAAFSALCLYILSSVIFEPPMPFRKPAREKTYFPSIAARTLLGFIGSS